MAGYRLISGSIPDDKWFGKVAAGLAESVNETMIKEN
jgi:hypothetical protein